jgi:glyoxylase I family protein
MKVRGIDHVSINVRNPGASAKFYADVLGFRQLQTVSMDKGSTITYFEIPGGGRMELIDNPAKGPDAPPEENATGLRHLAFSVDDVTAAEKMLRGKGVTIVLPATDLPSLGMRVLLFLDPSGVTLELCQEIP